MLRLPKRTVPILLAIFVATPLVLASGSQLDSGEILLPGETLSYGGCELTYQWDGNLVNYCSGSPVFSTDTDGTSPGWVAMQTDGNLVVYDSNGVPRWSSETWGHYGAYTRLIPASSGGGIVVSSGGLGSTIWYSEWGDPVWYPNACVQYFEAWSTEEDFVEQCNLASYYVGTGGCECHSAAGAVWSFHRFCIGSPHPWPPDCD